MQNYLTWNEIVMSLWYILEINRHSLLIFTISIPYIFHMCSIFLPICNVFNVSKYLKTNPKPIDTDLNVLVFVCSYILWQANAQNIWIWRYIGWFYLFWVLVINDWFSQMSIKETIVTQCRHMMASLIDIWEN